MTRSSEANARQPTSLSNATILVRAPSWIDDQRVSKIVGSRQHWICKSLAEWRDLNATRVIREFKNGEGFLYLGRSYRLSLVSDQDQEVGLQLKNGRFQLRRELVDKGNLAAVRAAFRGFYSERGSERIKERVDYIVAHELCHFHHLDHTEAFWNEVDKVIPKWRERKEWLRKNGAGLGI